MPPKPPSQFEPLLEELFDAGARVVGRALKRGAAAVVGSALEDVNKAGGEVGKRINHVRERLKKLVTEAEGEEDHEHHH